MTLPDPDPATREMLARAASEARSRRFDDPEPSTAVDRLLVAASQAAGGLLWACEIAQQQRTPHVAERLQHYAERLLAAMVEVDVERRQC